MRANALARSASKKTSRDAKVFGAKTVLCGAPALTYLAVNIYLICSPETPRK